jgi:hypothetical protein
MINRIWILALALILAGCSQIDEKFSSKLVEEGKQYASFLISQKDQLIKEAEEFGFNKEIIIGLYSEFERDLTNQSIIKLLIFHFDAFDAGEIY